MQYEITTGQPFFYGGYGNCLGMISLNYRMLDAVNCADLQEACNLALPRFPYFRARAVIADTRYVMEPNDAPFVVRETSYPIVPGSKKANGHLITVGCNGHYILFSYFHGLADARGLMPFIQVVLFHYCEIHYMKALQSPGLTDIQEKPAETEYADPFRFVCEQEDGLDIKDVSNPFFLPERRILPGCHQTVYPIIMPQNTFLRFTKSNDASPAVMSALLLARAIDEVHPEHTEPICVNIPVDFRDIVGHSDLHQNCICPITLQFTEKMRGLPLETQATMFRGQVFLKSDPPTLLNRVCQIGRFTHEVNAMPTLDEKVQAYHGALDIPVVSYAGRMDWGDISTYITQTYMCGSAEGSGINITVLNVGTNLEFSIMVGTETDAYYKAFIHQLDLNEVHYYYGKPVSYVPMKREF